MLTINHTPKDILDRWATKIVRKKDCFINNKGSSEANDKGESYDPQNYSDDIVLWVAPPDCLRLEFEDTPKRNTKYIQQCEAAAKAKGIQYCITEHKGGKSQYFNAFNIKGMPVNEDNNQAKKLLANELLSQEAKQNLDTSNLGWTFSPVIGHSHWKQKYNGAEHKIIRGTHPLDQKNTYPKRLITKLKKKLSKPSKVTATTDDDSAWMEDFFINYCCNNMLPSGSRHFTVEKNMAALLCHRKDWSDIKNKYLKTQKRSSDSFLGWERSIKQGNYDQPNVGEMVNFITGYGVKYNIPQRKIGEKILVSEYFDISKYSNNLENHHKKHPFFYDSSRQFWIWNDDKKRYERCDEVDLINSLEESYPIRGETVNPKLRANYINGFRDVGRKHLPQEPPIEWMQFGKWVHDIKTGKQFIASPSYFFVNPIPWEVGDTADTPTMDAIFEQWVGKQYVETLKEILAYCCYRSYPLQYVFCLHGKGSNGKGRYLALLSKFLGSDNTVSTELELINNNNFEQGRLQHKLVALMGETERGFMNKSARIKSLCGQDLIRAERKYVGAIDFVNYAKIIINTNNLPDSSDDSDGFYRRWFIIEWTRKFPVGADPLDLIPEYEYNNLARYCVDRIRVILKKRLLTNQPTPEEAERKYKEVSNPLPFFIEQFYDREVDSYTLFADFYTKYAVYLDRNNKRSVTKYKVSKELSSMGLMVSKSWKTWLGVGRTDTFVEGIDINNTKFANWLTKKPSPPYPPEPISTFQKSIPNVKILSPKRQIGSGGSVLPNSNKKTSITDGINNQWATLQDNGNNCRTCNSRTTKTYEGKTVCKDHFTELLDIQPNKHRP